MKVKLFLFSLVLFLSNGLLAQVSINTDGSAADPSAMLDIKSTNKGLLIPRMTANERDNISSPATGLMVYVTDDNTFWYYDGSNWVQVGTGIPDDDWIISGSNMYSGVSGNVGIGTTSPSQKFHVVGNSFIQGNLYVYNPSYAILHYGNTGLLGGAVNFHPDGNNNGLFIEANNGSEDGGIFFNGNTLVMWSPGDNDIMRVYDEDDLPSGDPILILKDYSYYGGYLGVNVANPDDELDVAGTAQISEYLKVGDPNPPASGLQNNVILYYINFGTESYWNFIHSICNIDDGGLWFVGSDYVKFDNTGSRHYRALHSPYIWLPENINTADLYVELDHECTLENGYDGLYIEVTEDLGNNWNIISSWYSNGYSNSVAGCDESCNSYSGPAWTGGSFSGRVISQSNYFETVYMQGTWVRFRLVGMEDYSNGSGDYKIYQFWLKADNLVYQHTSSGFQPGDIYAEGHIYAQSNHQIGDVAEYFPVHGNAEPGDLIAMSKEGNTNACIVADKTTANYLIGVYSTSPSVLINNPKEGIPVALTGRSPVKVCNENGEIKVGDFLTASSKRGYAMKATEPCFVIGRAMENFDGKEGKIMAIIQPGWYNPNPASEGFHTGEAIVNQGQSSITVFDDKISKYSRVFVTVYGNPGSYYWIDPVNDGSFTLNFEEPVKENIKFVYLINSASNIEEIDKTINEKLSIKKVEHDKECETCGGSQVYYIDKNGNKIDGIAVSSNPPSLPPDVNKVWTWDPVNGFVEVNSTLNEEEALLQKRQKLNQWKQQQQKLIEKDSKSH